MFTNETERKNKAIFIKSVRAILRLKNKGKDKLMRYGELLKAPYSLNDYEEKKDYKILLVFGLSVLFFLILIALFYSPVEASEIKASWYSIESLKKEGTFKTSKGFMANGKRFNEKALTCACRMFPLGSKVKIVNLKNNKSVLVIVTDRIGKRFANSRIDLSKEAFSRIADPKDGIVSVSVKLL